MEYSQIGTAEVIGMSYEDLKSTTDILLDYLRDRNLTLDTQVKVNGNIREVFNQREKAHMVDVRDLYLDAMIVRNISFVVFACTLFLLIYKKQMSVFYISYKKALSIFAIFFLVIGLFCLIDFNSFWTNFHYVFFPDNDLWLLDPRKDILIMMVPSKFFFDLCVTIVFSILIILLVFFALFKILDKKVFSK